MNYISFEFAIFVAVTVAIFYRLPVKFRPMVLLAASLYFYLSFDVRYLLYLLFVAGSTFACARFTDNSPKGRLVIAGCIGTNVLLWFGIKELSWLANLVNETLRFAPGPVAMPLVFKLVPVGISYYMLQGISYLVDVYQGKIQQERSFWKYLLYLSYFPAVVQGPISRYSELAPLLTHEKPFDWDAARKNLLRILFGMVKKMVVADRLGIIVSYCFKEYAELQGMILYVGAVAYAFQLYTDFSGCVDICRGVSGLLGIDLVRNFDRPYLAGSIKEFWNRWHLSLSRWLWNYIYIPLGGNRKGKNRKYINLLATFAVSSIWHGAGFQYIVWGLLNAVYQIVGDVTAGLRGKWKKAFGVAEGSASERMYRRFITFHLTVLAWIFFRSATVTDAFGYLYQMFSGANLLAFFGPGLAASGVSWLELALLVAHLAVLLLLEHRSTGQEEVLDKVESLHTCIRWGLYIILILDVVLFGVYGSGYDLSGFLYGGY